MKYVFQYKTQDEREKLLKEHIDKTVIMESNISDGNFITFSDAPLEDVKEIIYTTLPLVEFEDIKNQLKATQEAVDFLLLNGGQ